jgi:transcriptional regulator with XRE-family HTH domain
MSKSYQSQKNRIKTELVDDFQDKEYAHAFVNSFLNTSIATQIKVLREERKWTQVKLADLADMKQPRISVLEDVYYSNWSIKTLQKLAKAFDVVLTVSFETFSDRIDDILNLSREACIRQSRIDDLSQLKQFMRYNLNSANVTELFEYVNIKSRTKDKIESDISDAQADNEFKDALG